MLAFRLATPTRIMPNPFRKAPSGANGNGIIPAIRYETAPAMGTNKKARLDPSPVGSPTLQSERPAISIPTSDTNGIQFFSKPASGSSSKKRKGRIKRPFGASSTAFKNQNGKPKSQKAQSGNEIAYCCPAGGTYSNGP